MNERTVWILGAGFSRSLGGPLLGDFFRRGTLEDMGVSFPDKQYGDLGTTRYLVSETYTKGKEETYLWGDPEDFLAKVDEAWRHGRSSLKNRIDRVVVRAIPKHMSNQLFKDSRDHFDKAVRRALAAECALFLLEDDAKSELWSPYKSWAESLVPGRDTVISFNYDLVLDRLSESSGALRILLPHERHATDQVPVLKLHGSIDWVERNAACERADFKEIIRDSGAFLAIAAPGRSKLDQVQRMFEPLWDIATAALSGANRVIFIGYSFPKTDALAREKILSAIRAAKRGVYTKIEIVLGPDVSQADALRISELITSCSAGRVVDVNGEFMRGGFSPGLDIKKRPLWAEDYIPIHGTFTGAY